MVAPVTQGQLLAGKYRVDEVLGEGGMGVVVAATDVQLERRVALKFLLPEYVEHTEAAARFLREARAAAKIRSEHVARVIDVGTLDNGAPYMVMEYLEGSDLAGVMAAATCLSVEDATSYVLQACEAIAEAHAHGIIHRDLKPANLFLSREPGGTAKVKVLDFGISKTTLTGGAFEPSLTKTSALMGSPLYMSPEQMRSTRNVDARTDIWALGVILYELLARVPPFDGGSIPELSAKILLDAPAPLRDLRPDVPRELEAVILKALAKNPDERFPSVAELAVALVPFAHHRARVTVENITKILRAAGLSTSALSLPPSQPARARDGARIVSSEPALQIIDSRTASSWSGTHGPDRGRSAGRWVLALGTSASVLGVIGYLVLSPSWRHQSGDAGVGAQAADDNGSAPMPPAQAALAEPGTAAPAASLAPIPERDHANDTSAAEGGAAPAVHAPKQAQEPPVAQAAGTVIAAPPAAISRAAKPKSRPATSAKPSLSSPKSGTSSALPEFGKRK